MEVAVSVLNVPVTMMSRVAASKRHYSTRLWLGCLAGILAVTGCGRKNDLRSEAGATAVRERPAEEQPALGQAASEPKADDLLVPDNTPIPDLDNEEKRKGKGIPESAIILDLGGTVRSYAAELPFPVVKEQGEWVVLLGQEDSKLWVSAKFCNADGQIVCDIEKTSFR